jgi:hypothetical protein
MHLPHPTSIGAVLHRGATLIALLVLFACSDSRSTEPGGNQDLDGTPDLIVDGTLLQSSMRIAQETIDAGSCTSLEGNIPPGRYRTLRFSVSTPNVGDADVFIGDPRAHIDPNGDGNFADSDGLFEFAACHNHFHYRRYAVYELFPVLQDGSFGAPIRARKIGFCMQDSEPFESGIGSNEWVYRQCGNPDRPGNQGIAVGWTDVYARNLDGQFFLLTDPSVPVPPGPYALRVTVNPGFVREGGDPCPVTDGTGLCRVFEESDYGNNVAEIRLTIQ